MVGVRAEAVIAARLGPVVVGGGTAAGAQTAVAEAVAGGATALLSFGFAGGLDPALRPGAVLVPRSAWVDGRSLSTDAALVARLRGPRGGSVFAAEALAGTVSQKQRLFDAHGTVAVDLETAAVARAGLPFAILRAVCDPAERALPAETAAFVGADGRTRVARVASALLRRPAFLPELVRLGRDAAAARSALRAWTAAVCAQLPAAVCIT